MVISIETVVSLVIYLLVIGLVLALLHWLIGYIEAQFPAVQPFGKIARIILVVLAVLILIGIVLSFAGHPVVRFAEIPAAPAENQDHLRQLLTIATLAN